jgi:hypothetical protein
LISAATTGVLLNGKEGIIKTRASKKDTTDLTSYNGFLDLINKSTNPDTIKKLNEEMSRLKDNMSNTAQAAIQAANGGTVALDKLGAKFNWVALKAQALNAAFSATIIGLISFAISGAITLIDNYIRRVEIAHEATAQKIAEYEKQKSSIASLNDSLDGNYGMYN